MRKMMCFSLLMGCDPAKGVSNFVLDLIPEESVVPNGDVSDTAQNDSEPSVEPSTEPSDEPSSEPAQEESPPPSVFSEFIEDVVLKGDISS